MEANRYVIQEPPAEEHFKIAERAAENIGRMVDGNGLKPDQVRVAKHDTAVHELHGALTIQLKPKIAEMHERGIVERGETQGSKPQVMQKIDGVIIDFLKVEEIRKSIKKIISDDAGEGFAMETIIQPLKQDPKIYSVVDKCLTCNGNAKSTCNDCHGRGMGDCNVCFAQGQMTCPACFGNGRVNGPDGSAVSCNRCQGHGRMTCTGCNGRKVLPCRLCAGEGYLPCGACNASGHITHIYTVKFDVEISFALDRVKTAPDVLAIAEKMGVRLLAVEKHIDIFDFDPEAQGVKMLMMLVARFPVSAATLSVAGKETPALIAGLHGRVLEMEPFFDTVINPGIVALSKITKGPMAVDALLTTACRFRILKDTLMQLAHHTRRHVYLEIVKGYPVILSDKYARAVVRYAAEALLTLGRWPRIRGFVLGSVLTGLAFGGYFAAGARLAVLNALIASNIPQYILYIDIAVWGMGYALTFFLIKKMAAMGLEKLLPSDTRQDKGLPAAGALGFYALGVTLAMWLLSAFLAPQQPAWMMSLLRHFNF